MAGFLKRFFRSGKGAVAPTFALAAIPLVVAMGAVVDYTNAYDQKTAVQDAMDLAALAAGKKIGLETTPQLTADVNSYYHSNVDPQIKSPPVLQVALQTSTITLTTDLSVPTYFLGMIGLHYINFHVTSQATLALGTLEVAIALDNSGSITNNNNIATLRTAANNLATTLWGLGATSTKPNPIQIGVVPFSAAVNVGSAYQNDATATWLDKTGIGTYNMDRRRRGDDGQPVHATRRHEEFLGQSGHVGRMCRSASVCPTTRPTIRRWPPRLRPWSSPICSGRAGQLDRHVEQYIGCLEGGRVRRDHPLQQRADRRAELTTTTCRTFLLR